MLGNIVQEANALRPKSMALFPRPLDWRTARKAADLTTSDHDDMHAGEIETSILFYIQPEIVRDGWEKMDNLSERPFLLIHGMKPYTPSGVIGRPSLATPEKGQAVLSSLKESFTHIIEELDGA